jgi:hypothetical protein
MQRYIVFFIAIEALHVSGGFSARHQELKLYTASGICQASLLLTLALGRGTGPRPHRRGDTHTQ